MKLSEYRNSRIPCQPYGTFLLCILFAFFFTYLIACGAKMGQTVISTPDEYRFNYEANEKYILRAIEKVFKEKNMGSAVRVDNDRRIVETDYLIQNDWRTKSIARVKKLNWKECEVTLSIITEKKSPSGWEMRRLLDKEHYIKLFDTIDLKIYEEMYRVE